MSKTSNAQLHCLFGQLLAGALESALMARRLCYRHCSICICKLKILGWIHTPLHASLALHPSAQKTSNSSGWQHCALRLGMHKYAYLGLNYSCKYGIEYVGVCTCVCLVP